jgi:hypothetical protein
VGVQHNETQAKGLTVRTGVKAGGMVVGAD